jgi:hypothetical protein
MDVGRRRRRGLTVPTITSQASYATLINTVPPRRTTTTLAPFRSGPSPGLAGRPAPVAPSPKSSHRHRDQLGEENAALRAKLEQMPKPRQKDKSWLG